MFLKSMCINGISMDKFYQFYLQVSMQMGKGHQGVSHPARCPSVLHPNVRFPYKFICYMLSDALKIEYLCFLIGLGM